MMNPPPISMTNFAGFVVADAAGKLSKVKSIKRTYDKPYSPGADYWSRWRDDIEAVHRNGGSPADLDRIWRGAKDNRPQGYKSACEGYRQFWGKKRVTWIS